MSEYNKEFRSFLKNGLKLGVLVATGGLGITKVMSIAAEGDEETVELMTQDGQIIEVNAKDIEPVEHEESRYEVREGFQNKKFVMVIDLAKCKNAKKCVTACSKMHHSPQEHPYLKVYNMKDSEDSAPYWQPTMCMHCDKPPCVKVCPVDATFKRKDGLVLIDNDRCIGCRFCMAACPYSTRVFNWSEPAPVEEEGCCTNPVESGVPAQMGTVSKCDFCPDMVREGKLPECITACPNGVFYFGDKYEDTVTNGDETLRLSELLEQKAGYRLMEEFGTEPNVYYLPPVNRVRDFEDGLKNYDEFNMLSKEESS